MRQPGRIPIVLKVINWEHFLQEHLQLIDVTTEYDNIQENLEEFTKYWEEYYDLRLGQALINFGLLPDIFNLWEVEETDWLIKNNYCTFEDIYFWGVNFTKEGERLPATVWVPIKDITIDHIQNILLFFGARGYKMEEKYKEYFEAKLDNWLKTSL